MKNKFLIAFTFVFSLVALACVNNTVLAERPGVTGVPFLEEARKLRDEGKFLEARKKYASILKKTSKLEVQEKVRPEYEDLNLKILFSRTLWPESVFYEVKPGDSLYKIAKKFNTTIELLQRSNSIRGSIIHPGMKLKVTQAEFAIRIDRSENKLFLVKGEQVIKTYRVATGEEFSTPLGAFTIENKLVDPTWFHAGAIVPPDSEENILGTRWMGFDYPGYGIHGTTLPETIGTHSSAGCVRMLNEEVEELYAIIPLKTKVTVVE